MKRSTPLLAVAASLLLMPVVAKEPEVFQDCARCPRMVIIPAGSVVTGDPREYEDLKVDESPRPQITFDRPFALGMFEVTQAEWSEFMADNPSDVKGDDLPINKVNWRNVQDYLQKLNAKTGRSYRLPSESEWEYAARAGSPDAFSFGSDESQLPRFAWFEANSGGIAKPVGKLQPNAFGLYDMHGNVWEWIDDCYSSNYGKNLTKEFEAERQSFCYRVIRGGSVLNFAKYATVFHRASLTPVNFNSNLGFRVALSLP